MPGLFQNRVSWVGATLALLGVAGILFFVAFDHFAARSNPYWGIFAWVVFPAIMLFGAAVVALGMARERSARSKVEGSSVPSLPVLDLNRAKDRRFLLGVVVFVAIFIPLSAVGSYHAYEVSESVNFCGATCHTSMSPEHTAFAASPHAAVTCVDCHVGPGATGYAVAKTSGVRRMLHAMTDTFDRPIASPLQSLPHSSGTCASCHSKDRFAGPKLKTFAHYASDETNTPRQIDMVLHVGGRNPLGRAEGIHAHQDKRIEFAYLDASFQVIPWVKVTSAEGKVSEYRTDDPKTTDEQVRMAPRRTMDCVDCHNRVGHSFETPDRALNGAFLHSRLDASLPFLKRQAIELLGRPYVSAAQAESAIDKDLRAFYATTYPEISLSKSASIQSAVSELQRIFRTNIFPEMKASWESFPDNLGHFSSPGCYRCHGGNMKSAEGKVISKDCQLCHAVTAQSEGKAVARLLGKDFVHPMDMGDLKDATCTDCHTGKGIPQ